jgi:hypothetical protein
MTRMVVTALLRQMSPILKMAIPQQRSWCVLQLAKEESVTDVQRTFRTQFHTELQNRLSIYAYYKRFEQKGWTCKGKSWSAPFLLETALYKLHTFRQFMVHDWLPINH